MQNQTGIWNSVSSFRLLIFCLKFALPGAYFQTVAIVKKKLLLTLPKPVVKSPFQDGLASLTPILSTRQVISTIQRYFRQCAISKRGFCQACCSHGKFKAAFPSLTQEAKYRVSVKTSKGYLLTSVLHVVRTKFQNFSIQPPCSLYKMLRDGGDILKELAWRNLRAD